ncbi:MAG: hypothetical protein EA352_05675 [Gemmatimonadales bacterium]|nr:MAG: hypothetical protein EA352_05675 [Gemmatimonadales bacterium]
MTRGGLLALLLWVGLVPSACHFPGHSSELATASEDVRCREAGPRIPLPAEVRESSGAVEALSWPGALIWTHNDSGHTPHLFAVADDGALVGRVRVAGAANVDWEDMAASPCPFAGEATGVAGAGARGGAGTRGQRCLYIGDVGDNRERRPALDLYRVPEPGGAADTLSAPATHWAIRMPHGPRDIESLHVLEGERVFLVTKGRNDPVELYALPAPLPAGVEAGSGAPPDTLEAVRIQLLADEPPSFGRLVTGSSARTDEEGRADLVAIRTYETLQFHRPRADGRLEPLHDGPVNLRPLREVQGEAVTFLSDGRILLTSEAGPGMRRGSMQAIRCQVPGVE